MKKCMSCGKEVPNDSVFCPFCGTKDIKDDSTCPICKKIVPSDSAFCPFCGEKIIEDINDKSVILDTEVPSAEKQAYKTEVEKDDPGIFKRILSWIVLVAGFAIALILIAVVFMIVGYIFNLIEDLPSVLKLLVYLFGGATFLFGIIFIPYTMGLPLLISASEKVCPSKNGMRYLIFGCFIAVDYLWAFISNIIDHHISISHLAVALFGIGIAYFGKKMSRTL